MQPFVRHTGILAALDRVDVDTDQIIPKQFLKRIERTGFGQFLFNDWRFREDGTLDPDFELNDPAYQGASILVAGRNFGCGSSREHAPWALQDYGFRAVLAPSFADIFRSNCLQNGLLPVQLEEAEVRDLIRLAQRVAVGAPGVQVTIDLERQVVEAPEGLEAHFTIDPFRRYCLLNGLDDIGLTLEQVDAIDAYERRRAGWLPAIR